MLLSTLMDHCVDPPSLADDADLTALSAPVDDESTGDGRLMDNKMYVCI